MQDRHRRLGRHDKVGTPKLRKDAGSTAETMSHHVVCDARIGSFSFRGSGDRKRFLAMPSSYSALFVATTIENEPLFEEGFNFSLWRDVDLVQIQVQPTTEKSSTRVDTFPEGEYGPCFVPHYPASDPRIRLAERDTILLLPDGQSVNVRSRYDDSVYSRILPNGSFLLIHQGEYVDGRPPNPICIHVMVPGNIQQYLRTIPTNAGTRYIPNADASNICFQTNGPGVLDEDELSLVGEYMSFPVSPPHTFMTKDHPISWKIRVFDEKNEELRSHTAFSVPSHEQRLQDKMGANLFREIKHCSKEGLYNFLRLWNMEEAFMNYTTAYGDVGETTCHECFNAWEDEDFPCPDYNFNMEFRCCDGFWGGCQRDFCVTKDMLSPRLLHSFERAQSVCYWCDPELHDWLSVVQSKAFSTCSDCMNDRWLPVAFKRWTRYTRHQLWKPGGREYTGLLDGPTAKVMRKQQ